MGEEKKLSASEVRKTIAVSLAAAFGFVIALMWKEVVMGGLNAAGIKTTLEDIDLGAWLVFLVVSIVITILMIVLIIVIGRWGNK